MTIDDDRHAAALRKPTSLTCASPTANDDDDFARVLFRMAQSLTDRNDGNGTTIVPLFRTRKRNSEEREYPGPNKDSMDHAT